MNREFGKDEYVKEITGKEFRESGALFFVNQQLHLLGMALTWNPETDEIKPALTRFRGFGEEQINNGYNQLSKYMVKNAEELLKDTEE